MARSFFRRLFSEERGSMIIETAIVAPVLAVLALGTFEIGTIVSRQHELQSAASEGEIIALAAAEGAETTTQTIEDIIKTSVSLSDEQITISRFWRCNANPVTVTSADACEEDDVVSSYIRIAITDSYQPIWADFGFGDRVDFNVQRTVQLS